MQEEAFPSSHNALPLMSSLLPSLLNNLHSCKFKGSFHVTFMKIVDIDKGI
jgi:hypothetical protein